MIVMERQSMTISAGFSLRSIREAAIAAISSTSSRPLSWDRTNPAAPGPVRELTSRLSRPSFLRSGSTIASAARRISCVNRWFVWPAIRSQPSRASGKPIMISARALLHS
jgi:hypothetical protein